MMKNDRRLWKCLWKCSCFRFSLHSSDKSLFSVLPQYSKLGGVAVIKLVAFSECGPQNSILSAWELFEIHVIILYPWFTDTKFRARTRSCILPSQWLILIYLENCYLNNLLKEIFCWDFWESTSTFISLPFPNLVNTWKGQIFTS